VEFYQLVDGRQLITLVGVTVAGEKQAGADGRRGYGATPGRPPNLQEAAALAHPLRLRIVRLCLDQALTIAELAGLLDQRPATVLDHVRALLATGFLAEEPWRSGARGAMEKPYRATGKPARDVAGRGPLFADRSR
ncbi:MAG TPA: winged helix-turn-helix domain-containing protein, partial [Acidimicrobiales bacterium]|nr:winged helix-turn-helix domain-containing protein [Acidimicrobiales bacterium]